MTRNTSATNIDRLNAQMSQLGEKTLGTVQAVLFSLAQEIAEDARSRVYAQRDAPGSIASPLAESIQVGSNENCTFVEARAPYAVFVELGTSTAPAEPFLQPAFDQVVDDARRDLGARSVR